MRNGGIITSRDVLRSYARTLEAIATGAPDAQPLAHKTLIQFPHRKYTMQNTTHPFWLTWATASCDDIFAALTRMNAAEGHIHGLQEFLHLERLSDRPRSRVIKRVEAKLRACQAKKLLAMRKAKAERQTEAIC